MANKYKIRIGDVMVEKEASIPQEAAFSALKTAVKLITKNTYYDFDNLITVTEVRNDFPDVRHEFDLREILPGVMAEIYEEIEAAKKEVGNG